MVCFGRFGRQTVDRRRHKNEKKRFIMFFICQKTNGRLVFGLVFTVVFLVFWKTWFHLIVWIDDLICGFMDNIS